MLVSLFGCLPLAVIGADERLTLLEDIAYQSVGVVIVVGSLGFLAIMISLLGRILRESPKTPCAASGATAGSASGQQSSVGENEIPPEVRAAIVAAVYATLGQQNRILDIKPVFHPQQAAWSMEGRRQIFLSHRVR